VGEALYGMLNAQLPKRLKKGAGPRHFSKTTGTFWYWIRYLRSTTTWGRPERLRIQHSRNFPAAIVAARSGHFTGLKHLLDIGGGSGVFAVPLALENPDLRITLVELPNALPNVRKFLQKYSVETRIELKGCNVHLTPWPLDDCDGILFANFMHFCSDEECLSMLKESNRLLPRGGRLLLHEMLWNDNKDGPLVTALWNFWVTSISAGRQRTKTEFADLLIRSGFQAPVVFETCGGFSLIVSTKA
jgi:ubiquinone/menaquinone biosynthesis C-methylase UbiE